jgi:hypothetical protein
LRISTALIEVDDLIKLVNLAILTGRVKNGKRVSMLLVGDTETGKTQILEVFMGLKPVIWANDLSAKIIVMDIARQVEEGKTHILIPDILKILSHQKVVARNTITMLNAVTEEGLKNVMFYGSQREFKQPVKCGLIAAITKSGYNSREKYWKDIGFIGRCIPVSFSYSEETKMKIHEHIRKGFPPKTIDVVTGKLTNVEIPSEIGVRVQDLALIRSPLSTGFRLHKQLRALAQAHALYCNRSIATEEDFEEIRRLSKFMNLDYSTI